MKRFAFLHLKNNSNQVLMDVDKTNIKDAIAFFKLRFPGLPLDSDGYYKNGDSTYCVAEYWKHYESF